MSNFSVSYESHRYPRRSIDVKRVMMSGCSLSFTPSHIIEIVDNYDEPYDYLVMEKVTRTVKALISIAKGIPIINKSWIL